MKRRQFIQLPFFCTLSGAFGTPAAAEKGRVAVVYFSKTGHTESIARQAANLAGGDLFRVETVEPYPQAYREATEVVKDEMERGVVRALRPLEVDVGAYDVFILCTPTWWHHVAAPLQSWIKSADLAGKLVLTANSHGGGGRMETRADFERLLPKSRLGTHLTVYGSAGPEDTAVRAWLQENGLL